MKTAILEFPAPEACDGINKCKIRYGCTVYNNNYHKFSMSNNPYDKTRHPDCPLKIEEDDLHWIKGTDGLSEWLECQECKNKIGTNLTLENEKIYEYCPSCRVKLLPPKESEG